MLDKTVMDFVVIENSSEAQFIFLNPEDANYSAPSES
jgi:hypothetical protein